jgi:hypothetical protein
VATVVAMGVLMTPLAVVVWKRGKVKVGARDSTMGDLQSLPPNPDWHSEQLGPNQNPWAALE